MNLEIGKRIKKERIRQNRTLQDIADSCGFSKSLLCKIERGKTLPPISTLTKIAESLGLQVANLIREGSSIETVFTPAQKSKKTTMTNKGYSFFAFATEKDDKIMQPYLFIAEKGKIRGKALSHQGEEFIYILEGNMKYRVGKIEYTLSPGDSLYFNSLEEHELRPLSNKVVYLGIFSDNKIQKK
ncbi:MAG TPA: cupin domain-containing protein [Victivallales bacterium]|nr:cupin domain-containing protein [Victivallales bacterium]HRR06327.1 cupin domain-containing protein [Victivallales bacterium]HRR28971.1 cupin domain-containing protein [Victivallales bacterium]HRU00953.1 cupin domain-containing protein [Victivallales bacterium]